MSSVGLPVVVRCLGALVARTHVWPLLHLIVPGPASPFSPCSSTWRVGPNPAAGFTAATAGRPRTVVEPSATEMWSFSAHFILRHDGAEKLHISVAVGTPPLAVEPRRIRRRDAAPKERQADRERLPSQVPPALPVGGMGMMPLHAAAARAAAPSNAPPLGFPYSPQTPLDGGVPLRAPRGGRRADGPAGGGAFNA